MFPFRIILRRRVVVNLDDGTAIEGVLIRQTGPLLHLKDAYLHEEGVETRPLSGDTIIERSRVIFIQAP